MASSDSSTQQQESNLYGLRSRQCLCGYRAEVKTSWKAPTAGRRFYCCEKGRDGGCRFFDWADGEMCSRSQAIIPGLLNKCDRFEKKIAAMENEKENGENEMRALEKTITYVEKVKQGVDKENKWLKKENKRLKKEIRTLYVLFAVCIVLLGGWSLVMSDGKGSFNMKQIR